MSSVDWTQTLQGYTGDCKTCHLRRTFTICILESTPAGRRQSYNACRHASSIPSVDMASRGLLRTMQPDRLHRFIQCFSDFLLISFLREAYSMARAICLPLLQGWRSHLLRFYGRTLMPRNANDYIRRRRRAETKLQTVSKRAREWGWSLKTSTRLRNVWTDADNGGRAHRGPACQAVLAR